MKIVYISGSPRKKSNNVLYWFYNYIVSTDNFINFTKELSINKNPVVRDAWKEFKTYYAAKTKPEVVEIDEAQFLTIECKCEQVLHIGHYSTEPESLAKMKELMEENKFIRKALQHEIYLSDPRRIPEEKIKTILR